MIEYKQRGRLLALISNACLHGLIEGVTRFITRDVRCNGVTQAGVLLAHLNSSGP